ncbi:MAG: NAD(P)-binding domain-containing protein [Pseudomonadota bacterium]
MAAQTEGDVVYMIGGCESGIAQKGKEVVVLDRGPPWLDRDKDPSRGLSPCTQQRLDTFRKCLSVMLIPCADVVALKQQSDGIQILAGDGRSWVADGAPVLATGFGSGTARVSGWFEYDKTGVPLLTGEEESTSQRGLFLVGPQVSHQGHLFCFIYKFRQRFAASPVPSGSAWAPTPPRSRCVTRTGCISTISFAVMTTNACARARNRGA